MSNTQFAFLSRFMVPDRDMLQSAVDKLGYDLRLDPGFARFDDVGFLPFTLEGKEDAGFEIYYEESSDVCDGDEDLEAIADGRDYCISMVWRSKYKDLACVMIVSCALAKFFNAVISYGGEEPEGLESMLASIPGILEKARAES